MDFDKNLVVLWLFDDLGLDDEIVVGISLETRSFSELIRVS